jgi:hypothetical protein
MAEKEKDAAASPNGHPRMVDPFQFKRPGRSVRHLKLTDWAQPGAELVLSLRAPDTIDMALCAAEVARMTGQYLTGTEGMGPGPFPLIGEEPVPVSAELFGPACLVYVAQVPPEESRQERIWNPEHLVAWSITMPHAWAQVMRALDEMDRAGRGAEGNLTPPLMAA